MASAAANPGFNANPTDILTTILNAVTGIQNGVDELDDYLREYKKENAEDRVALASVCHWVGNFHEGEITYINNKASGLNPLAQPFIPAVAAAPPMVSEEEVAPEGPAAVGLVGPFMCQDPATPATPEAGEVATLLGSLSMTKLFREAKAYRLFMLQSVQRRTVRDWRTDEDFLFNLTGRFTPNEVGHCPAEFDAFTDPAGIHLIRLAKELYGDIDEIMQLLRSDKYILKFITRLLLPLDPQVIADLMTWLVAVSLRYGLCAFPELRYRKPMKRDAYRTGEIRSLGCGLRFKEGNTQEAIEWATTNLPGQTRNSYDMTAVVLQSKINELETEYPELKGRHPHAK